MASGSGPDCGSLLLADGEEARDARFLLSTTAVGQTLVLLEQVVLGAALDVYASDPFPLRPAGWGGLLEGSLEEFLAPRDIYSMSYFLSDETKRWGSRISACRALAEAARGFRAGRADGFVDLLVAARDGTRLQRHAAWRCLAACAPLDGPTPRALWTEVSAALGGAQVPDLGGASAAEFSAAPAADLDAALDAATAPRRRPPLAPSPALPPGALPAPVIDAVVEQLARARVELAEDAPALHAARLDRAPSGFAALAPLANLAAGGSVRPPDVDQLWRYAWARSRFRGEPALLAAVEGALRAAGRAVPQDPRAAA